MHLDEHLLGGSNMGTMQLSENSGGSRVPLEAFPASTTGIVSFTRPCQVVVLEDRCIVWSDGQMCCGFRGVEQASYP